MLQGTQLGPRMLWSVTVTAAVANDRVTGITPENPTPINPAYLAGVFTVKLVNRVNLTLDGVRLYGALGLVALPGAGPAAFPNAGAVTEALWTMTSSGMGVGGGLTRQPTILDADAGNKWPAPIIPNWLMLEYSTSAPGAGAVITFEVWATMIGQLVGGVH